MKNKFSAIFILLFLIINANSQEKYQLLEELIDDEIMVDSSNIPVERSQFYIPVRVFHESNTTAHQDSFRISWYSNHLWALQEPILFNRPVESEIYRFTWLRSFHHPISIRIEKMNEKFYITWKKCDGAGGYDPGNLIIAEQKEIELESWSAFKSYVEKSNFWGMSSTVEEYGLDGAEWILEGVDPVKYHFVKRWSAGGDYRNACMFLLELTDLKVKKKYIY